MINNFKIIVEGKYAAFNPASCKVERFTSDVPTPSALIGLIKSIYWHPPIDIVIDKIVVFNDFEYINMMRNETTKKVNIKSALEEMNNGSYKIPIIRENNYTQRNSVMLKNVKYGIEFHLIPTGLRCDKPGESLEKHCNIMKRRLENGQCFRQPFLGCSECPVDKFYLVKEFNYDEIDPKIRRIKDMDLGLMTYRMVFEDHGVPINNDWNLRLFRDVALPVNYHPHLKSGVIDVAEYVRNNRMCG